MIFFFAVKTPVKSRLSEFIYKKVSKKFCHVKKYSFLCKVINNEKQEIMKIQAKDIKVGMTVQTGVITMKVEKVVNGFQKNGKAVVTIIGNAERFMMKGKPKMKIEGFELKLKEDTKVNI